MKKNTVAAEITSKDHELYLVKESHRVNTVTIPPEMEGRADARELREFLQSFLSIGDRSVRRQILDEVKRAAMEEC